VGSAFAARSRDFNLKFWRREVMNGRVCAWGKSGDRRVVCVECSRGFVVWGTRELRRRRKCASRSGVKA